MIDPQSRSLEWIEQASSLIPNIADTASAKPFRR